MTDEKILIAEKSTFVRIMLKTLLEDLGFEVLGMAKDGQEALAQYQDLKPNIMLVDVELDGIDGIEVTREITAGDSATVILMLIGESQDTPEIIVEAVRAGAKGYIRKPLSEGEIEKRISGALELS